MSEVSNKRFVHFEGTKQEFIDGGYPDQYQESIVFINGDGNESNNTIYTHGEYYGQGVIAEGDASNSAVLKNGNNKNLSDYSISLGRYNISGLKGWYYSSIYKKSNTQIYVYLSKIQKLLPLGDEQLKTTEQTPITSLPNVYNILGKDTVISLVNDVKYDNKFKIVGGGNGYVILDTVEGDIPFTHIKHELLNDPEDYSIYCVEKPDKGMFDMGQGSVSMGYNNKATNGKAVSVGYANHSYGKFSFTEGRENKAAYCAHAEGRETVANGNSSHSEGYLTSAVGTASHSEGQSTTANKNRSHAEGTYSYADGVSSHVEGYRTKTGGDSDENTLQISTDDSVGAFAHAEGNGTLAYGNSSHAEGLSTLSSGKRSHAEGNTSKAKGNNSHAEGWETQAIGNSSHAEGVKTIAGTDKNIDKTSIQTHDSVTIGYFSHAEGNGTRARGNSSHSEGIGTLAYAIGTHAEGYFTEANYEYSHAEGYESKANASHSHAEGYNCIATGERGHAEGYFTIAQKNSHSEGVYTYAFGERTHAEGSKTIAYGNSSHAEGQSTTGFDALDETSFNTILDTWNNGAGTIKSKSISIAYGVGSHVEGKDNLAEGNYSHCGGEKSHAKGIGAFSHGKNVNANGNYSVVFGEGITMDTSCGFACGTYSSQADKNKIFVVGCGSNTKSETALSINSSGHTNVKSLSIGSVDVLSNLDYHGTLMKNDIYKSVNIYPYKRHYLDHSAVTQIVVKNCSQNAEYFIIVKNPTNLSTAITGVTLKHPYGANLLDYSSYDDGIVEINLLGIDSSTVLVNSIIYQ